MCWRCYCGLPEDDPQRAQMLKMIDQQSALLLWLLFCKLDTDGQLKIHFEVRIYVYLCMYIYIYIHTHAYIAMYIHVYLYTYT